MLKKFNKLFVALVITSMVFTGAINVANATGLSSAQISAIVSLLQAFGANSSTVQNVEDVLYGRTTSTGAQTQETNTWCYTFNKNLRIGDTGDDVNNLAYAMQKQGYSVPDDSFGETLASVIVAFQEKYASEVLKPYGLTRGTGYVGSSTRAKLNQLYGCENKGIGVSASIETSSEITNNKPYIVGRATGVDKVSITIGNEGGKVYSSGMIQVINYRWDVTISEILSLGQYTIYVYGPNGDLLISKPLKIISSTPSTSNIPKITSTTGKALENWEAYAGLPLTIIGENLLGGADTTKNTYVYINGITCPIVRAGNTYLECTVPSTLQAGTTYGLYVKNSAGTSNKVQIKINSVETDTNPSITVLSPNGGESFKVGEKVNVRWNSVNSKSGQVSISLYYEGGGYENLIGSISDNGSYTITIPSVGTGRYKISVDSADKGPSAADNSDNYFTVTSESSVPSLKITQPNGGEGYISGQSIIYVYYLSANITGQLLTARLYHPINGYVQTATGYANQSGSITIDLRKGGGPIGGQYKINLCAESVDSPTVPGKPLCDSSDNYFNITAPTQNTDISVLVPATGGILAPNYRYSIVWKDTRLSTTGTGINGKGVDPVYIIGLQGSNGKDVIADNVDSTSYCNGSLCTYWWTTPNGGSTNNQITVYDYKNDPGALIVGKSGYFTITAPATQPSITVLSPNGGETLTLGGVYTAKWSSVSVNNFIVSLCPSNGSACTPVTSSQIGGPSLTFTVPLNLATGSYRLLVNDPAGGALDYSDSYFTLAKSTATPAMAIIKPNGGETYQKGSTQTVQWTQNFSAKGTLNITDSANNYLYSASVTGFDGFNTFTLPSSALNIPAGSYKLLICADYEASKTLCDSSDSYFKVSDTSTSLNSGSGMTASLFEALRLINPALYK